MFKTQYLIVYEYKYTGYNREESCIYEKSWFKSFNLQDVFDTCNIPESAIIKAIYKI